MTGEASAYTYGGKKAIAEAHRLCGGWTAGQPFAEDLADEIFERYPDLALWLALLRFGTFIHPKDPGDRFMMRNRLRCARAIRKHCRRLGLEEPVTRLPADHNPAGCQQVRLMTHEARRRIAATWHPVADRLSSVVPTLVAVAWIERQKGGQK